MHVSEAIYRWLTFAVYVLFYNGNNRAICFQQEPETPIALEPFLLYLIKIM